MPIYTYECAMAGCLEHEEVIHVTESSLGWAPQCEVHGETMRRVLSLPAQHRMGGTEGKLRTHEHIKQRNDAYYKSSKGKEEHRANVAAAHKRLGLDK